MRQSLPERTNQTRRILHIMDSHVTDPDPVPSAVRAAGGEVERCSNVYEGLSRLGRAGSTGFDAVVLCLDYLTVDEYEFIRLAKQCASGVPVLVHGGAGSMGDVGRAVAMGADRWAEGLRAALVGVVREGTTEPRRDADAKRQAETSALSGRGSAGSVGGVEALIGDRGDWSATEDDVVSDDDTTVRVPWSRGSDVPVRRPPGKQIAGGSDARRQAERSVSCEARTAGSVEGSGERIGDRDDWLGTDEEPLLSEGELSALAGVFGDGENEIDADRGVS